MGGPPGYASLLEATVQALVGGTVRSGHSQGRLRRTNFFPGPYKLSEFFIDTRSHQGVYLLNLCSGSGRWCLIVLRLVPAASTGAHASFTTILPAIKYPLGVCLGAGSSRPKVQGTCWVLPCDPRSDPAVPNVEYQVRAEKTTAGPRCIKLQGFHYDKTKNKNKILKPNGPQWAVQKHGLASEQTCVYFECKVL